MTKYCIKSSDIVDPRYKMCILGQLQPVMFLPCFMPFLSVNIDSTYSQYSNILVIEHSFNFNRVVMSGYAILSAVNKCYVMCEQIKIYLCSIIASHCSGMINVPDHISTTNFHTHFTLSHCPHRR